MPAPASELTSVESGQPSETDAKHPGSAQKEYIYVPDNFKVKEGARLTENLVVGKPLGVGLQGGVFLLQDNDGKVDPNQVLKAVFKFGIGGLFGMTNLEREWRVGRQLALLTEPGEALSGFMGTGSGVVTKSGKFRAMFLERIVGRDVTKPISAKGFHDVHYLRQMLYCVFKSLHPAQRKLAFHHADLRLANIMELMPETHKGSTPSTPTGTGTPRSGRMQDASHHDSHHVSSVLHPDDLTAVDLREVVRQPQAALPSGEQDPSILQGSSVQTQAHDPVLAHTSSSMAVMEAEGTGDLQDGNFKMIDFGLADFREVFGAGYVTGKHRSLIHNEPHHVQPLRQQNSKGSSNEQDTGKEEPEHRHLSGLRGNKGISKRSDAVPKGLRVSKFFPTPAGLLPQVPPMERLYRYFWRRKGDVYALLWDMQRYIDGRVWPEHDELEVRLMMDLIRHVTGVHVKAWFAPLDEDDKGGDLALRDERSFSVCGILYRNEGAFHWLRIRSLRIRSFLRPANAGLTAAEALTAPFFTYDQDRGFFLDA